MYVSYNNINVSNIKKKKKGDEELDLNLQIGRSRIKLKNSLRHVFFVLLFNSPLLVKCSIFQPLIFSQFILRVQYRSFFHSHAIPMIVRTYWTIVSPDFSNFQYFIFLFYLNVVSIKTVELSKDSFSRLIQLQPYRKQC